MRQIIRPCAISAVILLSIFALSVPASYAQGGGPARVVTDTVTERNIAPTTRIVGVVDFDTLSGLSPEVSGRIEESTIEEGEVVEKGEMLVRLNTDLLKKDIQIRQKEVEQIGVKIANTRKNLNRFETLFKEAAASEKAYDDLADSLRELVKQQEMVKTTIERLRLQIDKSTLEAPFDGLVLEKLKDVGEWVSPGVPVCTLGSVSDLFVQVAVSEELVAFIEPGQEVVLVINALNREFTGRVANFVPIADPATKTFEVKIAIPYFEEVIRNMSATVNVPAGKEQKLRMIKRDALVRNQGKTFVYTIKEGKAAILPVNIVGYEGEYVGVDNPYIQPGMPVVVDGNDRLRPDQEVTVVEGGK
jgi:RND family efflux transporter MFP subunit